MISIGQLLVLTCFCAAFGAMLANQHSRFSDLFVCTIVAIVTLQISYIVSGFVIG
jgi:hypothetical protein